MLDARKLPASKVCANVNNWVNGCARDGHFTVRHSAQRDTFLAGNRRATTSSAPSSSTSSTSSTSTPTKSSPTARCVHAQQQSTKQSSSFHLAHCRLSSMSLKRRRPQGLAEMLAALHSFRVDLELRDGRQINAVIEGADSQMNVSLSEAVWTSGAPYDEDSPVWISGRSLRYVVIPSGIDPIEAIDRHREKVRAATAKYARGIRPAGKRGATDS